MYILSVTSVTPVTPLDLKWHVFLGWFFTIGQDVAYVGGGSLIELPETAVLTAYLLKPKVCQCQPDFGGIDLHIRRKSCRYLRGSHVLRLRFGAGVHEVGDEKFGGRIFIMYMRMLLIRCEFACKALSFLTKC